MLITRRNACAAPLTDDGRKFTPTMALRPGEQVQIDTTRLDVLALYDDGSLGRPELTIAVDVATRAILAAVLCPAGTQAVDAALLLAEMAVPHPARPTWPDVLRFAHSAVLPGERLMSLDERLHGAAARPVVVPETVVVDRGKGVPVEGVHGRLRSARDQRAGRTCVRTDGQGHRGSDLRVDQHLVLPAPARVHRLRRHPPWQGRGTPGVIQRRPVAGPPRRVARALPPPPHEGLRHRVLPKVALSPNQM
ncbi:hypothetical protein [Streptomyces sp. NPDC056154]|uniref:hypothetical protein n=1 Tax=unclassified Streptomyces TaxID=2593676 RepID=UPI0035DCD42D